MLDDLIDLAAAGRAVSEYLDDVRERSGVAL